MKFEELKELDAFNAFDEFTTVADAKALGIIPKAYHDIFKETCDCGSDFIVKTNLSTVQCCNPRCYIKLGYMLAETLGRFDVKGIGPETCLDLVKSKYHTLKYKSHVEFLAYTDADLPYWLNNARGDTYLSCLYNIRQHEYSIGDLSANLAIPAFDSTLKKLLKPYSSFDELVNAISEAGGISNYLNSIGISDKQKAFYLKEFLPDLVLAEYLFAGNVRLKGMHTVNICITGYLSVEGRSMTKKAFVELLNLVSKAEDGTQLLEFNQTSAVESVPYIVADAPSTNSKYLRGKDRNVLITSTELLNEVRKVVGEYNDRQKENV